MKNKSAIILPLKENFTDKDFGAVSIWVKLYLEYSKFRNNLIFCKKIKKAKYLSKYICPIEVNSNFFTNINYIKKINHQLIKKKIKTVEIHNRPEYVFYLKKNNPNLKINLIFHNNPNQIRKSTGIKNKNFLLENCNKIIFVSNWIKSEFFKNLKHKHKNNIEVIYNFINPIKTFPKKQKTIIFAGKLNSSKGYNIFGQAIIKILDKYPEWNSIVFGNESREKYNFNHKRLKIVNWIDHKKLLKMYEKSSISIVNPTWDEPFGRTAMESASRGCAVITSNSGGLSETFKNNYVLKINNSKYLFNKISNLIKNKNLLKKIQKQNFNNVINTPAKSVIKLDNLRYEKKFISNTNKKYFKILHLSNFGIKNDFRLFNLSISKKISNGLIRNGHDVIDFDYRNYSSKIFDEKNLDYKIISVVSHYKPDLILFGHNNVLSRNTLEILKNKFNCKLSIWFEDHVVKGDPNYKNNLTLLERNNDLIDKYFITTSPTEIKSKIKKEKLHFLPIPVDPNIESYDFSEIKKDNDIFFAISHGVNYGKLKSDNYKDDRFKFIEKFIKASDNSLNFNLLGFYNIQPKWNYNFLNELMYSKFALNLSRGGPTKYCSSNRIATIMGNGIIPLIDQKVKYQDFFDNDEIITYKNINDLISKLLSIKDNNKLLIKKSKLAKKNYFEHFENTIVADFIISMIFNTKNKFKYIWSK